MSNSPKNNGPLTISTRAADQLGQAIARYRGEAELTQAELAQSAGLRQATISKVEKGLGTTELDTIYAVCAALGLELVLRPRPAAGRKLKPEDVF